MSYRSAYRSQKGQGGAVLIVALVFTLILTVISVASMQSATLQERMAGNTKDVNVAFQAAEAGLREAETVLSQVSVGPFNGSKGLYLSCPDPDDHRKACSKPDWADKASKGWFVLADNIDNVARQPEYIIEEMSKVVGSNEVLDSDRAIPTDSFYRVTARGYGASDRSMVVLSTTYRRAD